MVLEAVRQLAAKSLQECGGVYSRFCFSLCALFLSLLLSIQITPPIFIPSHEGPVTCFLTLSAVKILGSFFSPEEKNRSVRLANLVLGAPGSFSTSNNIQTFFSLSNVVNKSSTPGESTAWKEILQFPQTL